MHIKTISDPSRQDASYLRPRLSILALAAGVMFTLGCHHDEVSHATPAPVAPAQAPGAQGAAPGAPHGMPMGAPAGAPAGMPGGMGMPEGQLPPPPKPTGAAAMKWSVPKGWTETPGSGMRYATLTPPGPGKAELAIVVLPGAAGGEPANVNRWRGQIGLAPMDDNALAGLRKPVKSKAGTVSVYDFTSEGAAPTRMISGLLASNGSTWFLKLTGEATAVGKAKPDFMHFLESLHLD